MAMYIIRLESCKWAKKYMCFCHMLYIFVYLITKDFVTAGCTPRKCGRVVFDTLVKPSEVAALLNIAKRGLSMGGSTGGASILDLHSGALSHGNAFVNIFKLEEARNLFTEQDFKIYRCVPNEDHNSLKSCVHVWYSVIQNKYFQEIQ